MGEGGVGRGFGSPGGSAAGPGGVLPAPTGIGNILVADPAGTATWVPDGLPGVAAADAGKLWYWNPTTKLWTLTAAPTASGQVPVWNHTTKVLGWGKGGITFFQWGCGSPTTTGGAVTYLYSGSNDATAGSSTVATVGRQQILYAGTLLGWTVQHDTPVGASAIQYDIYVNGATVANQAVNSGDSAIYSNVIAVAVVPGDVVQVVATNTSGVSPATRTFARVAELLS